MAGLWFVTAAGILQRPEGCTAVSSLSDTASARVMETVSGVLLSLGLSARYTLSPQTLILLAPLTLPPPTARAESLPP